MMKSLDHEVFLYSSEIADDVATEHITCITENERLTSLGGRHYTEASFNPNDPHWLKFNVKVIEGIKVRRQPKDFICVIGGTAHKPIADALPDMMTVEFGIGYPGTFAKFRVFESYAWMHTVYGASAGDANTDGHWFDEVIPNYYDISEFPLEIEKDDYYLFVGRLIDRKGWHIAQEVCDFLDVPFKVAGPGEFSGYGEYLGVVGHDERNKLMSKAKAVFVPTQYIEPFGGVAIEAMLCGTPIITTDWGAFTETNIPGVTGWRCRTFSEFLQAAQRVDELDPVLIRKMAEKYSMEKIGLQYENYFERLLTLWDDGWYNVK